MAEDNPDDRLLIQEAFRENRLGNDLFFVQDGDELMEYLYRQGRSASAASALRLGLILLDLNMPRRDGHLALAEIKADPRLRQIPAMVLTTSKDEKDILCSYDITAAGFITKPVAFASLVDVARKLSKYWFETVELPVGNGRINS